MNRPDTAPPVGPDRISVPQGVLVREIQGESVLLDLDSETYFGLDEIGSRMWQELTSKGSIDAACDTLLAEYEVARPQLEMDIRVFVDTLVKAGLLRVGSD